MLGDGHDVDGVQESDGAAVVNVPLNRTFRRGLLVTHDGQNTPETMDDEGEARADTNFKFTRWEDVAGSFEPELLVKPYGFHPRRSHLSDAWGRLTARGR